MSLVWNILLSIYLISIFGMVFIIGYTKYKNPFITFKKWKLFWRTILPILNTWLVLTAMWEVIWITFERKQLERKRKNKDYIPPAQWLDRDIDSMYPELITVKEVKNDITRDSN